MEGLIAGFGVLLLGFSVISTSEGKPEAGCYTIPAEQFKDFMDDIFFGEWLIIRRLRHIHWVKFGKLPDVTLPGLEYCRKEIPEVLNGTHYNYSWKTTAYFLDLPKLLPTFKYGNCNATYLVVNSEPIVHTLFGPFCDE